MLYPIPSHLSLENVLQICRYDEIQMQLHKNFQKKIEPHFDEDYILSERLHKTRSF